MEQERYKYNTVRSVERTLDIFEFMSEGEFYSLSQISKGVKLHKSTAFNLLTTLIVRGYVENNQLGEYRLTTKTYRLGRHSLEFRDLWTEAQPIIRQLKQRVSQKVFLVRLEGISTVFEGEDDKGIVTSVEDLDLKKVILGGIQRLRNLLEDPEDGQTGNIVLAQGFYIDDGGEADGYRIVLAPIRNHLGILKAVICIAGVENEMPMDRILETGRILKEISGQISNYLGFHRRG